MGTRPIGCGSCFRWPASSRPISPLQTMMIVRSHVVSALRTWYVYCNEGGVAACLRRWRWPFALPGTEGCSSRVRYLRPPFCTKVHVAITSTCRESLVKNDLASRNIEHSKRLTERYATLWAPAARMIQQGFSIPGTVSSEFGKKELHSWRAGFYTRLLAHAKRAAATAVAAASPAAEVEAATPGTNSSGTPEKGEEAAREAAADEINIEDGYPKVVAFAGKRQVDLFLLLKALVATGQSS